MTEAAQNDGKPGPETSAPRAEAPPVTSRLHLAPPGTSAEEDDYLLLSAIVSASRDAIWSWRLDGTIASWNAGAERLFQYTAEEIVGKSIFTLIPPDIHGRARAAMRRLARGNWYGQYETDRVRRDGARLHVELTVSPILDSAGRTIGVATIGRDVTDRKHAERARQQLVAIVNSSEDAIVAKDLDGIITSWNPGAERLFGYAAEEAVGRPIDLIIPPAQEHEEAGILERIRCGDHVEPYDSVRRRKDGSLVDVSLMVSPVKDEAGRIVGASKIARDITERKRAEHMRELLTRELNHRIKNTLTVVQAMAGETFRHVPEASDALKTFRGRVGALSAAHDLLTRDAWEKAPLTELVRGVIDAAGQSERVEIEGSSVTLEPRAAVSLSTALHELCTNAIKHGALSNESGTVSIRWSVAGDAKPRANLTWRERGGPAVSPPASRGFGMLLLEHMLSQVLEDGGASFEFVPEGVVCTLQVPLAGDG